MKFYDFFALFGPFWLKNSADRSDLSLKAIKAKKANIRPNDSKLDFRIFRGLAMVPQHAKRSYKVPWRPIGIRFWEMTTPEPKKGPTSQKISFFEPRDPFLVLELTFLKNLSRLAFKALYKTSKHVGGPLFNL